MSFVIFYEIKCDRSEASTRQKKSITKLSSTYVSYPYRVFIVESDFRNVMKTTPLLFSGVCTRHMNFLLSSSSPNPFLFALDEYLKIDICELKQE